MADKNKILEMVKNGWDDQEIRGFIKYENYQKGWRPQTQEEERDILVYKKSRNPNIEYESAFSTPAIQEAPNSIKQFGRDRAEDLASFIENTDKDDGVLEDTARVIASLFTEPAAKIARSISPDNDIALRLIEANNNYKNQDPKNMGGVSVGANNAFSGANLGIDGLMMAVGAKDKKDLDQEAIRRYTQTEEEIERRKQSRRTEEENKADQARQKQLEDIKIDSVGNFARFGYEAAKDFFLDMTEAFGSEQVSQILFDPFNLIPAGVGLSSASKGVFTRIVSGAISGAVVNAPIAGATEYGKTLGMGKEDSDAFLKGAAGGAGIGAIFGGVGGAIPTPKRIIKETSQDVDTQPTTPINSVKDAIDAMQADYAETARKLGVTDLAEKSVNIAKGKELIVYQAQKSLFDQMREIGAVIAESDSINQAMIMAAKEKTQPNLEVSENTKAITKEINGGNSVTDIRLSGTGIINVVSNEIRARQSGESNKTAEQLFTQLKQRGISDELANSAIVSYSAGNVDFLSSYISRKINEYLNLRITNEAINSMKEMESVNNPNEKILKSFIFSDDLSDMYDIPMRYKVISAKDLNPNFKALTGTQYRFRENSAEINKVSQSFRPELHFGQGGFEGIPIINYKNQIIAGNHRAEGIKLFTPESRETYNKAAKEHFGEDVFDGVPYDDPVIVRELLSTDDALISRMSAYSNDRRVRGDGEKLIAAGGKYAERLKEMDRKGVIVSSENDLLGLGNLNAKDLVEAERALLYYQSPELARSLENYALEYPRDLRFAEIFTRNAINFWNLRQVAKKSKNTEADIMPYLARAIDKMAQGKAGNKKAIRVVLDEWEDILGYEMGLKGRRQRFDKLYDIKRDFYGDIFGVLLNYLSKLKDSGYQSLAYRLNALEEAIEDRNQGSLFGEPEPLTPAEAISFIMRNERDANPLMNMSDSERFRALSEAISLREDEDVSIITDGGGMVRLNEELQGTYGEDTIAGSPDGYSAGVESGRQSNRQNLSDIEREGQELSGQEIQPDDSGFDTSHIVQDSNASVYDRQGNVSEIGLAESPAGVRLENKSDDIEPRTQLPTDREEGSVIDLLSEETTSDLVGNKRGIGATTSIETRSDFGTARELQREPESKQRDLESKREQQSRAEQFTNTELGNTDNIAKQLPYLLPEQILDVKFVEDRFIQHRGVLITNQTGTGKTLSGLGVAKRFLKQGKNNILIVTPNQEKVGDWILEGKNLLIDVAKVENTKEAPEGVIATTYANFYQNEAILNKTYDLVIYDESHSLLENKRGQETSRLAAHKRITWNNYAKKIGVNPLSKEKNDIERISNEANNGKVLFLSATPFSSPKSLEYGNGLLFDKTNINALLAEKFNYLPNEDGDYMPPSILSGIDVGALERAFADSLVASGAMRGRKLNNGFDYARQFMKISNSFSEKFDEAMFLLSKNPNFGELNAYYRKKFNHIYLGKMGESVKAKEIIPFIKEAIADNNKIVIFHKYIDGGIPDHPFKIQNPPENIKFQYNEFVSKHPQFFKEYVFENPIALFKKEFGDAITFFNGIDKGIDGNAIRTFNNDDSKTKIIMIQSDAGSAGISLHDTTGKFKRIVIKLNLPTRPVAEIQSEGRTYRVGQKSDTAFIYPIVGGFTEAKNFSSKINESIGSVENLAMGDGARNLRESFRQDYIAGLKTKLDYKNIKFKDGLLKDNDSETRSLFASATKMMLNQDKEDIPYPLALKMSEWLDIRGFDSVLNPNARDGVFARYINGVAGKLTALEENRKKFNDLLVYTPNAMNDSFDNFDISSGFDRVIIDIPNGRMDYINMSIHSTKRGGRIVAYVDDNIANKIGSFGDSFSIVSQIKMPKELGGKNIVIIDKLEQIESPMKLDLSSLSKSEALDAIENMGMPKVKVSIDDALNSVNISNVGDGKYSLSFKDKISRERWADMNNNIKSWGGYYYAKQKKWIMNGEALINFKDKYLC